MLGLLLLGDAVKATHCQVSVVPPLFVIVCCPEQLLVDETFISGKVSGNGTGVLVAVGFGVAVAVGFGPGPAGLVAAGVPSAVCVA